MELFPDLIITPVLVELFKKINGNANSIQTNLGGGNLRYLSLTVTPAMYATLSATAFISP